MAQRVGMSDLVADKLTLFGEAASNAALKASALVAGMVVSAHSIEGMNLLRIRGWRVYSATSGTLDAGHVSADVHFWATGPPARHGGGRTAEATWPGRLSTLREN